MYFLLVACTKNLNSPIEHFIKEPVEKLYPKKVIDLFEFGILRPFEIIKVNDNTFLIQDFKDENIFNLINFSSRKIMSGGKKGQGPNEVLAPPILQFRGKKILTYDSLKKTMYEVTISSDSTLSLMEFFRIDTDVQILFMVNQLDSTFIATGLFGDYWLAEMNKEGKIFSTIDFPKWEQTNRIPKTAISMLYTNSRMANSPDNKRIVVVTHNQGVISFLYRTDSGIKEYKQIKYYPPIYKVTERGGVAYSRDNIEGFIAVVCDDNYIYTIYSGRTINSHGGMGSAYCENLLVYDWEGNPVKRYLLEIPIFRMSYDKEKNRIYGLGENPEGVLVVYQL